MAPSEASKVATEEPGTPPAGILFGAKNAKTKLTDQDHGY
jgi:hypothetical protein